MAPTGDGGTIAAFSGKELCQGEPDGSSFPTGGIRQTHQARGYTIWDVTSPAYILENQNGTTLCIPTAFVSWTGEALDKKTPLLRSDAGADKQAHRITHALRPRTKAFVASYGGPRAGVLPGRPRASSSPAPTCSNTGRTLFGAAAPKGQEFDDHYFGAIPSRAVVHVDCRA